MKYNLFSIWFFFYENSCLFEQPKLHDIGSIFLTTIFHVTFVLSTYNFFKLDDMGLSMETSFSTKVFVFLKTHYKYSTELHPLNAKLQFYRHLSSEIFSIKTFHFLGLDPENDAGVLSKTTDKDRDWVQTELVLNLSYSLQILLENQRKLLRSIQLTVFQQKLQNLSKPRIKWFSELFNINHSSKLFKERLQTLRNIRGEDSSFSLI